MCDEGEQVKTNRAPSPLADTFEKLSVSRILMIFKDVSERRKALEACGNVHWTRLSSTVAQSYRLSHTPRRAQPRLRACCRSRTSARRKSRTVSLNSISGSFRASPRNGHARISAAPLQRPENLLHRCPQPRYQTVARLRQRLSESCLQARFMT